MKALCHLVTCTILAAWSCVPVSRSGYRSGTSGLPDLTQRSHAASAFEGSPRQPRRFPPRSSSAVTVDGVPGAHGPCLFSAQPQALPLNQGIIGTGYRTGWAQMTRGQAHVPGPRQQRRTPTRMARSSLGESACALTLVRGSAATPTRTVRQTPGPSACSPS